VSDLRQGAIKAGANVVVDYYRGDFDFIDATELVTSILDALFDYLTKHESGLVDEFAGSGAQDTIGGLLKMLVASQEDTDATR